MADEQQRRKPGSGVPDPKKGMNFYWIYALIATILIGMLLFNSGSDGRPTDYYKFKNLASKGFIDKLEYDGVKAVIYLNDAGRDSRHFQKVETCGSISLQGKILSKKSINWERRRVSA
jgi:hypothetical protein